MTINRRDLCATLAAFATAGAFAEGQASSGPELSQSHGYNFADLAVAKQDHGGETRNILHGTLTTGEMVDLHETVLPPGKMPHPPHRHKHCEFMLLREGTIEFYNDGKPEIVGPGSVIFAASNVMHGWKNIGNTPASYFVFAVGDPRY